MSAEIQQLLAIIDQAYNRTSWHGTNLRGSIRRVSPQQAAWRPSPRRHNIWETVVHAAYWKYAAARRLTNSNRGSFPLKGSNWFQRPLGVKHATESAWRDDVELLDRMHDALRTAAARLLPEDLAVVPPGRKVSNFALLSGVAAHDLYHAGQIQLLKRLYTSR
jgi:DinB superfamily